MIATSSRPVLRICLAVCVGLAAWLAARPAAASVHLWRIRELYSSADGAIQYLELFSEAEGERSTNGEMFTITSTGGPNGPTSHTFVFTRDLTGTTLDRSLLIATPGYAALTCAPAADFTFPDNRIFDPQATSITVNLPFTDINDTVVFAGVPTNGTNSANRATVGGAITAAASSPSNQANMSGTLTGCDDGNFCNGSGVCANPGSCGPIDVNPCVGTCIEATDICAQCTVPGDCPDDSNPCTDATCTGGVCGVSNNTAACDDTLFCTMTDACAGGTCTGTGSPCSGATPMCNETTNMCGACLADADCNDSNACTDDDCAAGTCTNTNNTASCNDGLFCTATDVCSGGTCGGSGDACTTGALTECNETTDACVECLAAGDCDDALYCNGTESCASGACQAGTAPCTGVCVEASDTCADCATDGDCDDSNPCTTDDCDANGDCQHPAVAAGTPCADDGLFCTGTESCSAGTCTSAGSPCDPSDELCDDGSDECVRRCDNGDPAVAGACPEDMDADSGAADAGGTDAGADAAVDAGETPDGGDPGTAGRGPRAGRGGSGSGSAGRAGSSSPPRDAGDGDASDGDDGDSSGCDCRIAGAERTRGASPTALWLLVAAALWRGVRRRVRQRPRA
jgi:hypothetical protein